MDIYSKKSRWKLYLLLAAFIIIVISMFYTTNVADKLAEQERGRVELWAKAMSELLNTSDDEACKDQELDFVFSIVQENKTIPAILTDDKGNIESFVNLDEEKSEDEAYLLKQLEIMKIANDTIILKTKYNTNYVFYKRSQLLQLLANFPYFQMGLIGIFLLVGYLGFSSARRAEQNQVWVGFAKETAHQLGTPISSIVAWIEHLKETVPDEATQDILKEFRRDVGRLELITERFSKIGSKPDLIEINILENLDRNFQYIKRRAPRKVKFDFPIVAEEEPIMAKINPPLFDWVLENLLKNALDAMGGKGKISAIAFEDDDFVYIDVSDTGSGIPASKFKTVFKPGFSTKKRGWGLGLSLTTRIVKNYHNGRVFVKESEVGKGTTFRIQLPKK